MISTIHELNYRNNNGIEVFLLWDSATGQTFISVSDVSSETEETFAVAPENAADAFAHPYAYLTAVPNRSYSPAVA
jgi:hypothetical protein